MNYRVAEERIRRLSMAADPHLLQGGKRGLEKESLRISRHGGIAQTPHPRTWGSPLTHPHITTDYSEALTELITPPYTETGQATAFLHDVHQFLYDHMPDGELLWAGSMPCAVAEDQGIPIAEYGTSNLGRMKHIYRVGLDYRYGRRMQAIAGVHFNYSLPEDFWPAYRDVIEVTTDLREFTDRGYFAVIRNVHRYGWLIPLLFGSSPAVCKSFLAGRTSRFKRLSAATYYLPYATSLRMSDIGYKNKNQAALDICYDNLDGYVRSLRRAIETPYPEYEAIGTRDGDDYIQLNTNILQIENEYYSVVRPKRTPASGEQPSAALRRRGVEYVEVRALDVDPFSPTGVVEERLRFIEALLIFCLLEDSPPIDAAERRAIEYNELTVALRGRDHTAELQAPEGRVPLRHWATAICQSLLGICALLDKDRDAPVYSTAVQRQIAAIEHPDALPSARFLAALRDRGLPFAAYTMELSERHAAHFRAQRLAADKTAHFEALTAASLDRQRQLEADHSCTFEQYLQRYFTDSR